MKNITRVWIGNPYIDGHFNGTAFFIDAHTLVTAKHVILNRDGKAYGDVFLSNTPDGGITPIQSITLCERDIAILKVKKTFKFNKQDIIFTDTLGIGDNVNIVGFYDRDSSQKSYENRVSGYQNYEHTYELQNHLTHGLSGSPVFLEGKISGVIKAINSSKNLTYVIPIEEVCQELKMEKEVQLETKKKSSLSIKEIIFNEIYSLRVPFIIILALMVGVHKLLFVHGYALQDAMLTYIVFAYFFSKVALFIRKKLQRKKDVSL
ncbi:MAG: Unknown protein [uncultured Sulfurovum sp.]|uniref:Serine protease n=1 Tax=uncultured Sulfurovum sp. TaxID=269237 RepID=A0A6S6SUP6_9BACT|nr:MAG: Unknown protein [uncultured Sulfurovum sp.]